MTDTNTDTAGATATGSNTGPTAGEVAERIFSAVLGATEIQAIYFGDRLGWYQALAARGPLSSVELAEATDSSERYAREWLEHQAVSGYLTVDDADAAPTARRYAIPTGYAEVLTDADSLNYLAPLARFVGGAGKQLGALVDAYRTGGGISWASFGDDYREAQAALNRPMFLRLLCQELLPAAPEVAAALRAGAMVADIGCGEGWSSIAIAAGYPEVRVDGFDPDTPAVLAAERHAAAHGVADRVRFHAVDAATALDGDGDGDRAGRYDLAFAFECVHDMADPVAVLAAARALVGDDGSMIIMDERAGETFSAPGGEVERLLYGYSLLACLPDGMSSQPSVATGTVMRPATLAGYARQAGFSTTEVLPIEHEFFRFYRLVP